MSFDMEILLSHLDAEYRIELDQYKEESDSDVSDTEHAMPMPNCPIAQLPGNHLIMDFMYYTIRIG